MSSFHSALKDPRENGDSFHSFSQINTRKRGDSGSSFQSFKTPGNKNEFASFEEHG